MKKTFFFLLASLLFFSNSFGQLVTSMPEIDDQTSYETDITKVEITDSYTIISFVYQSRQRNNAYQMPFPFPNQRQMPTYTATISINPASYLNGNGKRFRYIKALGIPELPEEKNVQPNRQYRFTVYYEKLEPGIETFNLIEGKNRPNDSRQYWNFYGVHINNPLRRTPPAKKAEPETPAEVFITVKGKILDAKTNNPIVGKVIYRTDYDVTKSDSIRTNNLGEYSFKIKPEAYTFIASANGYDNSQESIDLSKLTKSQQFSQNIYLNPIVVEQKETSPVKIEENKFRLDKVFFEVGESTLLPESFVQLDGLVNMLKDNPNMKITVEGHTDNVGDPTQNRRLSLDRAYNVRDYLIKNGISGTRIQFKGYGDTKPVADNSTEEGRKQNRRVEFVIQ